MFGLVWVEDMVKRKRKKIDWEPICVEYRAGQLPIREIARQHSVSAAGICQIAKRRGWTRDLKEVVNTRVKEVLTNEDVNSPIVRGEIIEFSLVRVREVLKFQRKGIKELVDIISTLAGQLRKALKEKAELKPSSEIVKNLAHAVAKCFPEQRNLLGIPDIQKIEHSGPEGGPIQTEYTNVPPQPETLAEWEKQVGEARKLRVIEGGKK